MSGRGATPTADAAVRAYRLLLRAYPAAFRAAYGGEMEQLFRDQGREARRATDVRAGVGFWAAVLWDVARSAPGLRLDAVQDALRARRARRRAWRDGPWDDSPHTQPKGGTMRAKRTVAAVTLLGGGYEVVNTGAQVWAGYPAPNGGWALAMALATLMGVLLLTAGVALLGRGPGATRLSRGAALACLALVVGLQFAFPFMSIFERLFGVGLPVALLLVTRPPRGTAGRHPSVPAVA